MRTLAAILFSTLLVLQLAHGARRDLNDAPIRTLLQEQEEAPEIEQEAEEASEEEAGIRFNYGSAGTDWADQWPDCGLDAQSPINIITADIEESTANELHTRFNTFGVGSNVKVLNKGQSVEVTWDETVGTSVLLPVVGDVVAAAVDPLDPQHEGTLDLSNAASFSFANVEPLQFHMHMSSENAIDGHLFPLEAHLVTRVSHSSCGEGGCIVVFATLFRISESVNFFLEPFIEAAPEKAGEEHAVDMAEGFEVVLDELFPSNMSFYTWQGSFTTPPCTEGVTWLLFDNIGDISQGQLALLQSKMASVRKTCMEEAGGNVQRLEQCMYIGDLKNNRPVQPLNSRRVEHVDVIFAS
jgi:carbonic anhydrase